MIGRLRGTLVDRLQETILVEAGGVGYEIMITPRTLSDLPGLGEDVVIHTHLHTREDALALFGFATADERDIFRVLLGASGVGPKVALAICGTLTPIELRKAVAAEDAATLELVPGIGKRTAQKMIIELRPKLDIPDGDIPSAGDSVLAEVRQALDSLGYQPAEVRSAVASISTEGDVEDLVRQALQHLGGEQ